MVVTYLGHHEGECVCACVEADKHADGREEAAADLDDEEQTQNLHVHPVGRGRRKR